MRAPFIIIIAGPNGVGKTTFARRYLASIPECDVFVNADDIAESLIDIPADERDVRAGRITIKTMDDLVRQRRSFAIETTLSGRSLAQRLLMYRSRGYYLAMIYLWIQDVNTSIARVQMRIREGGHSIDTDVLRRRIKRSKQNFHELYRGLVDECHLYDWSTYGSATR
ncbi:MAG TPA: AAA family ATPase [Candidatus Didemnitutus sp.]|nr:AAA family ATPase [Candidatus Didemnitutus sp.]